jgi:hypothetical protein
LLVKAFWDKGSGFVDGMNNMVFIAAKYFESMILINVSTVAFEKLLYFNFRIHLSLKIFLKFIVLYTVLLALSMAFCSCNHEKDEAVTMQIINNEFRKNNRMVTYHINHESKHSAVTTIYYKASCKVINKSDTGTLFLVFDSVKLWQSADGHYLGE